MRIAEIQVQEYGVKDSRSFTLFLEILSDKIKTPKNLTDAVYAACTEFIGTEQGKKIYSYNCNCFNWADFEINTPPKSICKKHGFIKIPGPKTEMNFTVDWDEHLVNDDELPEE